MRTIATLQSRQGRLTTISFVPGSLKPLASSGYVDAFIVETEDGFSPLWFERSFLSADLGIAVDEIRRLADWNRFRNPDVSLIALPSRRDGSLLCGVILAASETSESYRQFVEPLYGRRYRNFYYNVNYEAIAYASRFWGAMRIAILHLSAANHFHSDIATCNAEALAHFCDAEPTRSSIPLLFLAAVSPRSISPGSPS